MFKQRIMAGVGNDASSEINVVIIGETGTGKILNIEDILL